MKEAVVRIQYYSFSMKAMENGPLFTHKSLVEIKKEEKGYIWKS